MNYPVEVLIHTSDIYYRKKKVDRGIVLSKFGFLSELKYSPVYCSSVRDGYISKLSKKRKGLVYIPIDQLDLKDIFYIVTGRDWFRLAILEIGSNFVRALLDTGSKKGFSIAVKKHKKGE